MLTAPSARNLPFKVDHYYWLVAAALVPSLAVTVAVSGLEQSEMRS